MRGGHSEGVHFPVSGGGHSAWWTLCMVDTLHGGHSVWWTLCMVETLSVVEVDALA